MCIHGWIVRTSDPTHGHLSDCDDRGDAVGGFGFASFEAVGHPLRSLRSRVPFASRKGRLLRSFHQDGDAEIDVLVAQGGIA